MKPYTNYIFKFAGLILIASLLMGCEKVKDASEFDLLYNVPQSEISIDSGMLITDDEYNLVIEKRIHLDLDSIRDKHNFDKIEDARFDYIRLEALSPANMNLDWITNLRATVSSAGSGEQDIATYAGQDAGKPMIDLRLSDVSILEHLMNETFTLKIYTTIQGPLPDDEMKIITKSRIRITVQPI